MAQTEVAADVKEIFDTIMKTDRHERFPLHREAVYHAFGAIGFAITQPNGGSHWKLTPGTDEAKRKWGNRSITLSAHEAKVSTATLNGLHRNVRKAYGWTSSTFVLRGEAAAEDIVVDPNAGRAQVDDVAPPERRRNGPRDAEQRRGGENDAGERRGGENDAGERRGGENDNGLRQDRPKKKKKARRTNVRLHS
ncbi:hypothetical protein C8Q76DRAFT_698372 [Earliella scabrosa]|nr:hypothetical protein C8Q76DRAFT_698372 [Earliella scabrosa]